jgi:hypothetical protein
MQYDQKMADEQRIYNRRAAEAFEKLVALPEWKFMTNYIEARATNLMQSILAPSSGGDGMTIALSAERSKGALQELNSLTQYIAAIMKNHSEERKSPHHEASDSEVPGVDRVGPKSEAEAVAGV